MAAKFGRVLRRRVFCSLENRVLGRGLSGFVYHLHESRVDLLVCAYSFVSSIPTCSFLNPKLYLVIFG